MFKAFDPSFFLFVFFLMENFLITEFVRYVEPRTELLFDGRIIFSHL